MIQNIRNSVAMGQKTPARGLHAWVTKKLAWLADSAIIIKKIGLYWKKSVLGGSRKLVKKFKKLHSRLVHPNQRFPKSNCGLWTFLLFAQADTCLTIPRDWNLQFHFSHFFYKLAPNLDSFCSFICSFGDMQFQFLSDKVSSLNWNVLSGNIRAFHRPSCKKSPIGLAFRTARIDIK